MKPLGALVSSASLAMLALAGCAQIQGKPLDPTLRGTIHSVQVVPMEGDTHGVAALFVADLDARGIAASIGTAGSAGPFAAQPDAVLVYQSK